MDFDSLTENYFKKEMRVKVIGRYYPSEAGQCLRKSYYSFINPKEIDLELTKIFEAGNIVHDFVSKVFKSDKNPDVEVLESETSFEIPVDDFVISGRIDNLVLFKGEEKKVLVEVKSTKSVDYLDGPQESHIMQLQLYLHARKMQEGVLVYVEKNTLKSKTFPVTYNPSIYEVIINRFKKLHEHLKSSSTPDPESRLLEDKKWMCRYCNYKTECFQETPEVGLTKFF
jgi:CRISPR/Cas system-associated exonuclease Cas4 (RecB family)|tara:strand:+ start:21800 stop:22480 length:681 start_codon:yes stop_codon:yes gene_type:complete